MTVTHPAFPRTVFVAALSAAVGRRLVLEAECGQDGFNGDDIGAVLLRFAEAGGSVPAKGVRRVSAVLRETPKIGQDEGVTDQRHHDPTPPEGGTAHSRLNQPDVQSLPSAERLALVADVLGELERELLRRREETAQQVRQLFALIPDIVQDGACGEANVELVDRLAGVAELAGCQIVVADKPVTLRFHLNVFQARSADRQRTHVRSGRSLFPLSVRAIIPVRKEE